jgi:hypothetical protein
MMMFWMNKSQHSDFYTIPLLTTVQPPADGLPALGFSSGNLLKWQVQNL